MPARPRNAGAKANGRKRPADPGNLENEGRVPPADTQAEAVVLSDIFMLQTTDRVRHLLTPDHFFSEANRRLYEAQLAVESMGRPIDTSTVRSYLLDNGYLERVGGSAYIALVADATPTTLHVETHAQIVYEKWKLREAVYTFQQLHGEGFHVDGNVSEFFLHAQDLIEKVVSSRADVFPPPEAFIELMRNPPPRIPTGIASIDDAFGGGIPTGNVVSFVGAPSSCKTTLAYQCVMGMREAGAMVCIVAYDEPPTSLLTRLGRHRGLDRSEIESGDSPSLDTIAEISRQHRWALINGMGQQPVSVDAAAAEVLRLSRLAEKQDALTADREGRPARKFPPVLLIDSIQRAWMPGIEALGSKREQIDLVVEAMRRACARGILVMGTSEAGRALYRGGQREGKVNAIAAGKESGSIEYRSDAMIVLEAVEPDDENDGSLMISGTLPKNRIHSGRGRMPTLWFVLDRDRSLLSECDAPVDKSEDGKPRRRTKSAKLAECCSAVEAFVRANPGCSLSNARARIEGHSNTRIKDAFEELSRSGRIVSRARTGKGSGGGEVWWVAGQEPTEPKETQETQPVQQELMPS